MFKRMLYLVSGLFFLGLSAWSELPKLAVFDVTIPTGFDSSVILPVTETIMEQLVASGKYLVLDRSNIEAIFKERDFQMSGEVSNDQLTQAGAFLGASMIVVSKIQSVGGAYFLSAKMIDTKSAAIIVQTSDSQQGDLSIVIEMARAVGAKLAGEPVIAQKTETAAPVTPSPAPSPKPASVSQPVADPDPDLVEKPAKARQKESPPADSILTKAPVFRIVADLAFPVTWDGTIGSVITDTPNYLRTGFSQPYISNNPEMRELGLEANAHLTIGGWFYLAVEYDLIRSQIKDSKFKNPENYYTNVQLTNYLGGLGLAIPLDYWGHIYGGGLIGATTLEIGDLWTSATALNFSKPTSYQETGLGYTLELGVCFYLVHFIVLDLRLHWGGAIFGGGSTTTANSKSYSASQWYILPDDTASPELGFTTLSFGVGLAL